MILQDAFSQQPRLKELMTTTPWSKLDSQSKEQLATSVEAALSLRYNTQREINNWTNIDALLDQDDIILGRQYG